MSQKMPGAKIFTHTGVVTSVNGNSVEVEVFRPEGCGACSMKSVCGNGVNKKLNAIALGECQPGQQVKVEITNSQGWAALAFGIVLPAMMTLIGAIVGMKLSGSETVAALAGLGSVSAYFGIFWLFRATADRSFIITARPLPQ
ncbi:MAG: hypothetical protein D6B26_03390 [Spirochaetaceae bacterium]|nr:MAG: hypothetical protein D6B26_03390 [Spirochaetaceae bacterium]